MERRLDQLERISRHLQRRSRGGFPGSFRGGLLDVLLGTPEAILCPMEAVNGLHGLHNISGHDFRKAGVQSLVDPEFWVISFNMEFSKGSGMETPWITRVHLYIFYCFSSLKYLEFWLHYFIFLIFLQNPTWKFSKRNMDHYYVSLRNVSFQMQVKKAHS